MFKSLIKPHQFTYATLLTSLTAGASLTPAINIANDADFEMLELRAVIHKAVSFTGDVLMQISTSGGDLFSNVGIDLLSFASVEQDSWSGYPVRLSEPIRIPANTVLNVQLTNNGGETVEVQVQLWGYKRTIGEVPC